MTDRKLKTIILHTGYAESESNYSFIASHAEGFDTAKEMLESLGAVITSTAKFNEDKPCCKDANAKGFKFCNECGYRVLMLDEEDCIEALTDHVRSFIQGISDGTHGAYEALLENQWIFGSHISSFINIFDYPILFVHAQGAEMLVGAVYDRLDTIYVYHLADNCTTIKE